MNHDFWKQFEGTPKIDCVKMKNDIQAKIYEETKDMTWEERIAYFQRGSKEFRREMSSKKEVSDGLVLREKPPPYGKAD